MIDSSLDDNVQKTWELSSLKIRHVLALETIEFLSKLVTRLSIMSFYFNCIQSLFVTTLFQILLPLIKADLMSAA